MQCLAAKPNLALPRRLSALPILSTAAVLFSLTCFGPIDHGSTKPGASSLSLASPCILSITRLRT
jgi:hypothetical protein